MPSTAKYSPLEHSGMEVVESSSAPEVVPGSSPPLERRSSNNQPEALSPTSAPYQDDRNEHHGYFGDNKTAPGHVPAYSDNEHARPSYINADKKEAAVAVGTPESSSRSGRRICGMKKIVFIILVIIVALAVIAAVLGGVLGALLPKKSNKSTQPQASTDMGLNSTDSNEPLAVMAKTGLATTISADDGKTLLTYFQDPDGRIIENSYLDGAWKVNAGNVNNSVVTDQATPGSPLAAVSYPLNGQNYRQLFFFNDVGNVMTTNTSATGTWSAPVAITTDVVSPSAVGLAACWEKEGMNGIRVYYGSNEGYIQEVGWQFNETVWTAWYSFDDSDQNSGVACAIYNYQDNNYINVYYRNTTSNSVKQYYWSYKSNDGWYDDGPQAWKNQTIAQGSDIAVCSDDTHSEYVFYQLEGGMVTRGILEPDGTDYDSYLTMQGASDGSKLAAAFVEGGAFYLFQNSSSDSTMFASDVSRFGNPISNIAVP